MQLEKYGENSYRLTNAILPGMKQEAESVKDLEASGVQRPYPKIYVP